MDEEKKISYCAIFQFKSDGINIDYPDLQGCLSCAYSKEQSMQMAAEALSLWLSGMKYSELPPPTSAGAIICQPNESVYTITVQVQIKNGYII